MAGCVGVSSLQRQDGERAAQRMAKSFDTPLHEPFLLRGGSNVALFVHGFPGSPAQTRPLAEALHAQGWTVQGLLMPGSGRDVGRLTSLSGSEWTNAVQTAVGELSREYDRVVVVAYSMGAAISCASLAPDDVDGLALIAPYQWRESLSDRLVWTFLRPFMPELYQPFRKSDLTDPDTRARLARHFPPNYLDSPEGQKEIRSFTLPIPLIANLRKTVRSAYGRKWDVGYPPILIIQGTEDVVAFPRRSQALAKRWAGHARYEELAGDHLLIETTSPAFPSVVRSLRSFAAERAASEPIRAQDRNGSRAENGANSRAGVNPTD